MIRVTEATWVRDHVLRLRFSDGAEGEIDLGEELEGPVFEPLRDVSGFKQFRVHPELHTVVWPNGADFAPEFLHSRVTVTA
ncbi:MAG TPA: DUF2442 domain-containing protein [Vicinamibacteria bacterium]|nr:DUF2442 domain-containing protein [Vicinamibacteria bacterium]